MNKRVEEEAHIWRDKQFSLFPLAENLGGAAAAKAGTGRG